jgi:hypothetical protein
MTREMTMEEIRARLAGLQWVLSPSVYLSSVALCVPVSNHGEVAQDPTI